MPEKMYRGAPDFLHNRGEREHVTGGMRVRFRGVALAATLALIGFFAWAAARHGRSAWLPAAQTPHLVRDLAPGRFLVARRELLDPNFAETVVVLVHYDRKGAMGLIVNRPTDIPLSRVFDELKLAQKRTDRLFLGGPVAPMGVLALVRTPAKPADARNVLDDVYLINDAKRLEEALAASDDPTRLRVFMGYAGWAAGQLEGEVDLGVWHIFRGDASLIFDPKPQTLWSRLIHLTELRIASARPPAATGASRRPGAALSASTFALRRAS